MNPTVKEIDRASLSIEQKLGMLLCANLNHGPADVDHAIGLVREHKLGAVWIQPAVKGREETIRRVLEAADYPIAILCDAEEGAPGYLIPQVISMTAAGRNEAYARSFGRVTASEHRRMGYNVICNPLLDVSADKNVPCGGTTRTFGPNKEDAARLGVAVARGMHEGGVLTVGKHYPGGAEGLPYDTHMREGYCTATREHVAEHFLYPYAALMKEGLLDGIMTGHKRFVSIDPERPTSLSRPVIDIIREMGFDGFAITDALNMMGIVLKYGYKDPIGMCIAAGNDMPLAWGIDSKTAYEAALDCYARGVMSDADIEAALTRILALHHKIATLPEAPALLSEDVENIERLNRECIAARLAEGLTPAIARDGKHLFTIVTDERLSEPDVDYTPGPREWFFPYKIAARIKELFPNSDVVTLPVFPTTNSNIPYFDKQTKYDDIVFITNYQTAAYTGREHLTTRVVDLMDALQTTDRIVAHLHFGNPFVAADAPYVPRILLGYASEKCVMHGLEILAGNAPALGVVPYNINFHKKGDIMGE